MYRYSWSVVKELRSLRDSGRPGFEFWLDDLPEVMLDLKLPVMEEDAIGALQYVDEIMKLMLELPLEDNE